MNRGLTNIDQKIERSHTLLFFWADLLIQIYRERELAFSYKYEFNLSMIEER